MNNKPKINNSSKLYCLILSIYYDIHIVANFFFLKQIVISNYTHFLSTFEIINVTPIKRTHFIQFLTTFKDWLFFLIINLNFIYYSEKPLNADVITHTYYLLIISYLKCISSDKIISDRLLTNTKIQ